MEYNTVDYSFARPYLGAGESILWYGKPAEGNLVTRQDMLMIPFSIVWCAFAIFWTVTAMASGAPFFFWMFGIPFVLVGLFLVFGRFLYTAYMRKRTVYVITTDKILRSRGGHIDMMMKASMPPMHVEVHPNGCGTIEFRPMYTYGYNRGYSSGFFALENLPDVARAQQAITDMAKYGS